MSDQPSLSTNFTTFADWCLHFDSLSEAAKHTVKILLEEAKSFLSRHKIIAIAVNYLARSQSFIQPTKLIVK